jgi:hypothetical protein
MPVRLVVTTYAKPRKGTAPDRQARHWPPLKERTKGGLFVLGTAPDRQARHWPPFVPTASAPAKTTSTTERGSPAGAGLAPASPPLSLAGFDEWHVGKEACGSPLHNGITSDTHAVRGSRGPDA